MPTIPARLAAKLRANVDAWYSDKLTHAEFSAINRATWAEIESAGPLTAKAVSRLLRLDGAS